MVCKKVYLHAAFVRQSFQIAQNWQAGKKPTVKFKQLRATSTCAARGANGKL